MSFLRTTLGPLAIASVSFLGCNETEIEPLQAKDTSDLARNPALPPPDPPPGAFQSGTYYVARIDPRRCAFPMCGGYFISAVNQALTSCLRGTLETECYVTALDLSTLTESPKTETHVRDAVGLDFETTQAVFLGDMRQNPDDGLGKLIVRMVWLATDRHTITGDFYRAEDNGIVCVAAPCPSYNQEYLNRGWIRPFHGLWLQDVPAHADDSTFTGPSLRSEYGLIVTGTNVAVEDAGPAGEGIFLDASQVFVPLFVSERYGNPSE